MIQLPGWHVAGTRDGVLEGCSLVVATFRRPDVVTDLLAHLEKMSDVPAEVVVVDGSPDDRTATALAPARARRFAFDLTYVRSPAGLTRQRNVGVDLSDGEILYFLDDDCVPEPGYFRAIRNVFDQDTSERVGGVSGTCVNEMGAKLTLRWALKLRLGIVPRVEPGTYCMTATTPPRSLQSPFTGAKRVDVLSGAAMAFRRSALTRERFSGFFRGYSQGEDLEMSRRIARKWELRWSGDARALHNYSQSGRPSSLKHGHMAVVNRSFIFRRHSAGATFADRARFWIDVAFGIVYDFTGFLRRPWQVWRLTYAIGGVGGAVSSVVRPPQFVEPPARKEYDLAPRWDIDGQLAQVNGRSNDKHRSVRSR